MKDKRIPIKVEIKYDRRFSGGYKGKQRIASVPFKKIPIREYSTKWLIQKSIEANENRYGLLHTNYLQAMKKIVDLMEQLDQKDEMIATMQKTIKNTIKRKTIQTKKNRV